MELTEKEQIQTMLVENMQRSDLTVYEEAQGFQMMRPHNLEVEGVDWRVVELARGGHPSLGFAYTFFNQDGFRTSSHVKRILCDILDRSFRARIDRWAMVTVNGSRADDASLGAFLAHLKEVIR